MDHLFQPVTSGNKPEGIFLQIEAAINSGSIKAGDRLPSERNLQNIFQTSRGVVREALHSLRQKGLLETKKGAKGGYYVKEVNINEAIDQLAMMIKQEHVPLGKLLDFQYAMDKAVLYSAVNSATDAEIVRMTEMAESLVELCKETSPNFEQIADIDNKLNLMMVEMARNPFFEWIMRTVQLSLRDYEFIVYQDPEIRSQFGLNWLSTARSIKARDLQKALRLYGHWYITLEHCLQKHHGPDILTRGNDKYSAIGSENNEKA